MPPLRSVSAAPLLLTISGLLGAALLQPAPARALEQVELRLPFLEFSFSVKLEELSNPASLLSGTSDLAELDQATSGAVGRQLIALFNAPLPLQVPAVVNEAEGSPMLNQALLLVSALGGIDGLPAQFNGNDLSRVLDKAAAQGPLTMLSVMRTLPGSTASVDLGRALFAVQRLASQQRPADRLLAGRTPASVSPALSQPGPLTVERKLITLPAPHRPKPLQVVQISPSQGANGRLGDRWRRGGSWRSVHPAEHRFCGGARPVVGRHHRVAAGGGQAERGAAQGTLRRGAQSGAQSQLGAAMQFHRHGQSGRPGRSTGQGRRGREPADVAAL
ncbi:MAG: hypothetical protein NTW83_08230 [Cyanobacteria bacterium]|nr:hypothetical protein [Cyanobacteriota bacterium]